MNTSNKLLSRYHEIRMNPFFRPIPYIFSLIAILWIIYWITLSIPEIYDLLELSEKNPLSVFTSIFIHSTNDQGIHLLSNSINLFFFAYIVGIQSSPRKMIIIFLLSGLLTNIGVFLFVEILNAILVPIFTEWAASQGVILDIDRLFSLSGGGASDAISGLMGFTIAYSVCFLIKELQKLYSERGFSHSINDFQVHSSDRLILFLNLLALFIGLVTLWERFLADLKMFIYIITSLYASISGSFLPFPTSRGHPFLAHIFGALFGILIGLGYLVFFGFGEKIFYESEEKMPKNSRSIERNL